MKRALLFLFLILNSFLPAFAWHSVGHMVVANIAYQHLNPNVKQKVDELVAQLHQEYPEIKTFLDLAVWPDTLRSQQIESFTHWHYIDTPIVDGGVMKNIIDTDNAEWALQAIPQVVKNPHANKYERARFLAFLVHIVGDVHQPLHTVARITASQPDGDAGGNLFHVEFNHNKTNLHAVWDIGLGEFEGSPEKVDIQAISAKITTQFPQEGFGTKVNDLEVHHWITEGVNNAKNHVYNTPENQPLSTSYITTGKRVADEQAALAGYRLAKLLNKLLG